VAEKVSDLEVALLESRQGRRAREEEAASPWEKKERDRSMYNCDGREKKRALHARRACGKWIDRVSTSNQNPGT
jgi:hypothetical protein